MAADPAERFAYGMRLFIDGVRRSRHRFADDESAEEQSADLAAYAREPLRGDAEMEALRGAVAEDIERALA